MRKFLWVLVLLAMGWLATPRVEAKVSEEKGTHTLVFGGGCFWCLDAVFADLKGVKKVVSGYEGGHVAHPSYDQVCTGKTGHAEVVEITYDASEISLDQLLEVFFFVHDPTTLNRQGNDVGTQYRSILFYQNAQEKAAEEAAKTKAQKNFPQPIVTQIEQHQPFYSAEGYHQDYFAKNPRQPYCSLLIGPKVEKFRKHFAALLKK